VQAVGQKVDGVESWVPSGAAFQVGDAALTQPDLLGQFRLGEAGGEPVLPQQGGSKVRPSVKRPGTDVTIVALGYTFYAALAAADLLGFHVAY
jgi:hypothetical protein